MSRRIVGSLLSAGVLLGLIGCGQDPNRPRTIPTSVTVTYEGQPVEGALVTFHPANGQQRGATARTDARGTADMWSFEPGDGVLLGSYKVTVSKVRAFPLPEASEFGSDEEYEIYIQSEEFQRISKRSENEPPTHELPVKYSIVDTSELAAEVTDGGRNQFTFELEGPLPEQPEWYRQMSR